MSGPPPACRYMDYEELVGAMQELVSGHEGFASMYSIGKSHQGRELWVLELTDSETGPACSKPGYYIDGNHHATEVAGSAVCIYTAALLLEGCAGDESLQELLRETAFYILPRVAVDGAEMFLQGPHSLRSSTRPYPRHELQPGLHPEDVDGDGRILQMRVPDPDGGWKESSTDGRLMLPRLPDERQGRFFRLYPEGVVHEWDGGPIRVAPSRWGLDLNRNYPAQWVPEVEQAGAGPFPLSEPETRAIADFLVARPNIAGAMSYHTTGGFILRPSCHRPDRELDGEDVRSMRAIGWRGEQLTGYPCVSTFEGFTGGRALKGVFMDWLYEHMGIMGFSTELWDAKARAGVPRRDAQATPAEQEEDGLKLLSWNDRQLGGRGFVNWYEVDHPQLGTVELGGWDQRYSLKNPPAELLKAECHKNALFTLAHARSLPRIVIACSQVERVGESMYRVRVLIRNSGYLPTYVVAGGRSLPWAQGPAASIHADGDFELLFGESRHELGHLSGRAQSDSSSRPDEPSELEVIWVVRTSASVVTVKASGARCGAASVELQLA